MPALLNRAIDAVGPRTWWLVWMDEGPSQWSGGNLHLYYRMREAYGDRRLLHEAPWTLFLQHESVELTTFVQLGVWNLWDIKIVTDYEYGQLYISHKEWLEISTEDTESIRTWLVSEGIPFDEGS